MSPDYLVIQDTRSSAAIPDSKVHGANMGPTWVLLAPDGPHVGPMNLAIRDGIGQILLKYSVLSTSMVKKLSLFFLNSMCHFSVDKWYEM